MEARISYPTDGLARLAAVEDQSYWFIHRNRVIVSVVESCPPPGPILDIGGGNGFVSLGLSRAGFDSIVVEPDPAGIAVASGRGLEAINEPLQALSVRSAAAVGMFDVLEHMEDDRAALSAVFDVLRPGGRFYVAVPAYNWLWSTYDRQAGHFRRYTKARLGAALASAGFTIEFASYFFAALVPAVFALRTLPSLLDLEQPPKSRRVTADHTLPDSWIGRRMSRSFDQELRTLRQGRSIPIGTSCIMVARKCT